MASLRVIKKDIQYLVDEVVSDCYMGLYFNQNDKDKEAKIIAIMEEAVELNNTLLQRVNNPAEKHNKSLVKKHYAQIHRDMLETINGLFDKLSDVCSSK